MKTFNVEDGCNVTVTALRNTRRCVALFRPRATCTNLMVTCDKFYLPNEDEARCRQVGVELRTKFREIFTRSIPISVGLTVFKHPLRNFVDTLLSILVD